MLKKKTEVVSIRIDDVIKEKLIERAETKNLTLNSLINQIVTKYIREGEISQDLGFTSIRKSLLKKIFKFIPNSDIVELSENTCKEFFKDTAMYLCGKYDRESVIMTLDSWFENSNIPFKKIESTNDTKVVIRHELGSKWALYFETMIKAVFYDLGIKTDSYVKTIHSISFRAYK